MGSPIISFSCAKIRNALSRTDLPTSPYYDIIRHVNKITREWQMILYICACHSIVSAITHYLWVAYKTWLAIFINKVYNTDMKPRAHRVCTFSRLFSDFQNSLALRNTTESSLTEGISCFALRLIGQGTEMSVFFPHLSKAEHVRQTKNIREIHAFHASLPPARPSTDDSQDVRTLVHVTTPAPIPCPACIWVKAEGVPGCFLLSEFGD